MPFEPVSPYGGFTGTVAAPEREPVPSADDSVWGAAFRTENVVGSSIASEEVRTAREQVGALGGPVRIDPDFDPWAEIADTPYESYTDQFAVAGNKDHFEAIKADIDRETKDRETIRKSGWTGIGASMAAGVLDLPILLPGGNIIRSAKGGVSLLRTAGSTAAYGTLAAAASESALHGSQQLRTGEESAVVIGGSTVLAGLLGAGIGKLFSRADQAAHAARIEQDFYVPGRGEPDPFTPGSVQVATAPGSSAKAASVADIIRQTAEEILPPGVRVEVADEIGLPKAGATDADSRFSVGGKEFTHQQDIFRAAWADTAGDFETVIAESLESSRVRRFPEGTAERVIFEDLVSHMQNVVKAVDEGDRAAAVKALEAGIAKAKELDDLVNAPSARLWTQRLRSAARKHLMPPTQSSVRQSSEGLIAEGRFDPGQRLITISASALDPVKTLKHETIHALRTMKLFTDAEWGTLEAAARKQGWVESNNVRALYEGIYSGRIDGSQYGLRAFHGSPFEFTSFDRSKAGTGEGTEWFGSGVYLTEEEKLAKFYADGGNVYEVDVDASKDKLLDLQKSMSEQSDDVKSKINSIIDSFEKSRGFSGIKEETAGKYQAYFEGEKYGPLHSDKSIAEEIAASKVRNTQKLAFSDTANARDFYTLLTDRLGGDPRDASKMLSEHGIRGIRFDANSFSPVKADRAGAENFVIFDESHVRIVRKNGEPISSAERKAVVKDMFSVRGEGKASTGPIDPKLENLLIEEAIAEQFSLWRNGAITVNGTVAKLFQRMKDFLDRVGQALRLRGMTEDDVFASVRSGEVAARATPAGRSMPAGGALAAGSGRAASVGAAARETVDNTLKPALGLETVRIDPLIYLQNSKSDKTKAYIQELAETPLAYKKNASGFETAPLGSEMGEPGAVESRIKGWQAPLAEGVRTLENAFMRYRKGRDKLPLDQLRTTIGDAISKPEKLTWRQFKEEVAKAARRGDTHEIPEVAQAAKFARQNVFDPLKDRAIAKELLPEDISVETAESYLNRLYNKEKIIARRPEFKEIVTKWLDEVEFRNGVTRRQLTPLLDEVERMKGAQKKLEPRITQREKRLKELETAAEEVAKFNKFAFERALKGSEKVAQSRQAFTDQATKLAARFEGPLETLREIKGFAADVAEVRKFARQVREAESQDESFILLVEDLMQIEERIPALIAKGDAELERLGKVEPAPTSAAPKNALTALRELSAELSEAIKPYKKQLKTAAAKLRGAEGKEGAKASERGAFSTVIRRRGNTLADQVSGRRAELDTMRADLALRNERITDSQKQIEALVLKYEGKTKAEAESAVKAREKAEAERDPTAKRLTSADKPIIRAAKKIIERTDKEPGETASLADEIIDRILGTPDGRLPYDAHLTKTTSPQGVSSSARGPLAGREFMIPDEMIEDFLENDFEMLMHAYVRTMAPDVELHARFGDVDMKLQFKEIQDDWARKAAAAASEKERRSLHAQRDGDIRRLAAIRDRLRGTYALPSNPDGLLLRTGRVMRSVNYMAMLGGQAISAIPDMGSIVFSHGIMRTFGDGIIPLFRNFSGTRLAAREVKLAGTALDMVLDSRAMNIGEIMDDYGRHTKFERGIQSMARSFGTVSLMSPWNAAMKQTAGLITMSRILRASDALARGKIKKPDLERLAASGISESNARKIAEQFKKHGTKEGGVWLPNTENWDKEARAAKEAFRVALVREVDKTIITPGQEKFLWMSTELGKSLGQFKSFSVSANQRLLISGLQQRDMGTLSGAALMVALGGLVHILKTKAGGREPDIDWSDNEKTSQFMVNAVDRSGLLGWLMEANAISEKVTGGKVGLSALTGRPISRYASRNLVGAMAGPTFGTLQSIGQVSSAGFTEWKETDTRAARRLIPYQNLLYMRHLFDQVEAGTNEFFGVPMKATRH